MLEMADPEYGSRGVRNLADFLITAFQQELRMQRFSKFNNEPIQPGEMPAEIFNSSKLIMIPEYFQVNDNGYKMPKLWKRLR